MDVAELIGGGATVAVAGVLLWAGLDKLRVHRDFLGTLTALGAAPQWVRRSGAVAVPALEISVALGLLLRPGSRLPQFGVVVLATAFAVAGLLGLRAAQPIRCACFGLAGSSLGRRQLYAFPLWIAAAIAIAAAPPAWATTTGTTVLAATVLAMGAIRAVAVERARRAAAATRRAVDESTGNPPNIFAVVEVPQ
jgi:hypothetical protein